MNRYLITPSLLNSWLYYLNYEGGKDEEIKKSFLIDLNREQKEQTEAMKDGIEFENNVRKATEGQKGFIFGKDQAYADCVAEVAEIVQGGAWQCKVYKNMTIAEINFFLYGKIDVLKGAYAYDIKYSESYEVGKYLDSAQPSLYLECINVPNFSFLISDGKNVMREDYRKEDIRPIENIIKEFIEWLPKDWKQIYFEKWISKEKE